MFSASRVRVNDAYGSRTSGALRSRSPANLLDVHDEQGVSLSTGLILRLELESGEPLTGTVGLEDGMEPLRFHGWIDFMVAIAALRARVSDHGFR